MACDYALSGDREKALEAAGRAVDAGFLRKYSFENDADLASVRDDPRFKALLARM